MPQSERIWPEHDTAWDTAEKERFAVCLRCRSAPPRDIEVPKEAAHGPYSSPFFCSSRCEQVFFGPAADWSAVYRQEVARTWAGGRRSIPLGSDGPEYWGPRDFVCRGVYLDLPSGRSYEPEQWWPPASLPPISIRPPFALGGRVGHLAVVEPLAPPPSPSLELPSPVVGVSASLPPTLTEGTSP